jgi:hypothetical protein
MSNQEGGQGPDDEGHWGSARQRLPCAQPKEKPAPVPLCRAPPAVPHARTHAPFRCDPRFSGGALDSLVAAAAVPDPAQLLASLQAQAPPAAAPGPASPAPTPDRSGLSGGALAGVVVGAVAGAALLAGAALMVLRARSKGWRVATPGQPAVPTTGLGPTDPGGPPLPMNLVEVAQPEPPRPQQPAGRLGSSLFQRLSSRLFEDHRFAKRSRDYLPGALPSAPSESGPQRARGPSVTQTQPRAPSRFPGRPTLAGP